MFLQPLAFRASSPSEGWMDDAIDTNQYNHKMIPSVLERMKAKQKDL